MKPNGLQSAVDRDLRTNARNRSMLAPRSADLATADLVVHVVYDEGRGVTFCFLLPSETAA